MSAIDRHPRPGQDLCDARGRSRRLRAHPGFLAPLALIVVAALLRFPTLAQQSFWLDEGYTERLVRMSFGGMLHAIPLSESTPPVYYALAWFWTRTFSYSEFGIRSLSAVAGLVTVAVTYAIAMRIAGRRAALIGGLLVAGAPIMVWFSQEARSYALATLLATVTVLCFVRFIQGDGHRWLAGWTASSAVGIGTHYFVGFIVAAELCWLVRAHHRDRRVLAATGLVLAIAAALLPLALEQRGTGHADYISQGSLTTRLLQVPKQFLVGYASPGQAGTSILVVVLVALGAYQALLRCTPDRRVRLFRPLVVGLVALLVPVALALVGVDFVNTRNLLPAFPPLVVVVAAGFASTDWRNGRVLAGVLAAALVSIVVLVDTHPAFQRDNWRAVSHVLARPLVPRAVIISPGSGIVPLQIYQSGLRTLATPARVRELDVVAIAPHRTGAGIASPPRGPVSVPAGFSLRQAVYASTYTVLRFVAPSAALVTPAAAGSAHLGTGIGGVAIQQPPAPG